MCNLLSVDSQQQRLHITLYSPPFYFLLSLLAIGVAAVKLALLKIRAPPQKSNGRSLLDALEKEKQRKAKLRRSEWKRETSRNESNRRDEPPRFLRRKSVFLCKNCELRAGCSGMAREGRKRKGRGGRCREIEANADDEERVGGREGWQAIIVTERRERRGKKYVVKLD